MAELLQFKAAGNGKKEDGRRDRFRFTKCPAKRAGNAFCWIFHVSRPCLPARLDAPARGQRRQFIPGEILRSEKNDLRQEESGP